MNSPKPGFINVDELMAQVNLEQVAAYYGAELPKLKRIGNETRMRCFLLGGKTAVTGDRALAIQEGHPAKQWKCHEYSCGKAGNLVSFCDLLKPGANMGGRPRGDRFKEIARDLGAIFEGLPPVEKQPPPMPPRTEVPKINLPLKDSPNERARGLIDLDRKFVVDVAAMPPAASAYFRRRQFLTPEVCRAWRMGYLPRDVGGEDKGGGTMRGKIVYPVLSEAGEVLTWFGRDPDFEEKHRRWEAGGRADREPEKFHFVKGFHRGSESFGQHLLSDAAMQARLAELGSLVVAEGSNDVIRLQTLNVPAVGLMSNTISGEQTEKIARWANQFAGDNVLLLLDCDEAGENGSQQVVWELAQHCRVKLGWTREMHDGMFKDRQPESLTNAEWLELSKYSQLSP